MSNKKRNFEETSPSNTINQEPKRKRSRFDTDEFEDYGDDFWNEVIASMERNSLTPNAKGTRNATSSDDDDDMDSERSDMLDLDTDSDNFSSDDQTDNDGESGSESDQYEYPNFDVDLEYQQNCKSIFRTLQSMTTVDIDIIPSVLISEYAASLIQICHDCSAKNVYPLDDNGKFMTFDPKGDKYDDAALCRKCTGNRTGPCGDIGIWLHEFVELCEENDWLMENDRRRVILVCECGEKTICSYCVMAASALGEWSVTAALHCEKCGTCFEWD